jgi:eukaryotic-like serine/threonine-protein kinase
LSEPETDKLLGSTVAGKYRVERLIGRGGMGAVYEATNTSIAKRVALKFLDKEASRDRDAVARFQREAESASAVESAHIVQIFDSGMAEDERPFLVMELLQGEDLRAVLRRDGKLPLPDSIHVAGQVARALSRAHAAGIVHRDLKPDNVFLCRRDDDAMFVKIVDFGISKVTRREATADTLTRRGTVLGTAFYMSPEQAQAFRDVDGRTDLYSLGSILFEMLTGRPPHTGTVYEAVLIDICTKNAPDIRDLEPDVPDAVAEVIQKALARDRAERYQDANELYDALALAAPGLLRTGGIGATRAAFTSNPALGAESGRRSTPRTKSEPTPSEAESGPITAAGTAVHPEIPDGRARRVTVVTGIIAALGAFAVTALAITQFNKSGDDEKPRPATSGTELMEREPGIKPSASTPIAPASSTATEPDAGLGHKPVTKLKPIIPGITSTKPVTTGPKPTGVATGLQLDPKGP